MATTDQIMRAEINMARSTARLNMPDGQVRQTTAQLLGLHLLGLDRREGGAAPFTPVIWQDMLATHGCAFGASNQFQVAMAMIGPQTRTLRYMRTDDDHAPPTPIEVRLPRVLAALAHRDGHHVRSMIFLAPPPSAAAPEWVTSEHRILTPWPYGNVYNSSGAICWGTVVPPIMRSPLDLYDVFFGSVFNRDLWSSSFGSIREAIAAVGASSDPVPFPAPRFSLSFAALHISGLA